MALDTKGRCALGAVIVGLLLTVAGFICLLLALTDAGINWSALIIAGGTAVGVGFVGAMIAALYLTMRPETEYSVLDEGKKKGGKPTLGAFHTRKSSDAEDKVPHLSSASKDHIYRMTLNLGSVDVQSEPSKSGKKPATDEGDPVYAEPGNDYPGNEYAESQEPGLMDGTKQFRD